MRSDIDGQCEECGGGFSDDQSLWGIQERTSGGKDIFHYYCSGECADKAFVLLRKTHKEIKAVTDIKGE